MKLLRKLPSDSFNDIYFDICLKSKSGCNIKVGDKNYNVYVGHTGEYIVNEFVPDFELNEEEYKK
jgi:hypothetical protein